VIIVIESSKVTIEVIEIEPVAMYKGTIYTRTIVGRLQDGIEIKLFDGITVSGEDSTTMGDDTVGEVVDVNVSLLSNDDVVKVTDKAVGIYASTKPSSEWSYDFVGEIIDIDLNTGSVLLDIGNGVVFAQLDGEVFQSLHDTNTALGDYLYLPAARADFEGIIE
jgi:hypothetical protein